MFVEFAADLRCEFECFRGCWKSGVVKGQRRSVAAVPGVRCVEKDGSVGRKSREVFDAPISPLIQNNKQVDRRKMNE